MWGVALQLLASPRRSKTIVAKTIENYSLPLSATQAIEALDTEAFRQLFARGTNRVETAPLQDA